MGDLMEGCVHSKPPQDVDARWSSMQTDIRFVCRRIIAFAVGNSCGGSSCISLLFLKRVRITIFFYILYLVSMRCSAFGCTVLFRVVCNVL